MPLGNHASHGAGRSSMRQDLVRHLMNSTTPAAFCRFGIVTVALGVLCLRVEPCPNTSFAPEIRRFSASVAIGNATFVTIEAIKPTSLSLRTTTHTPFEPHFPQEARGFVQLNSFEYPLHSHQHVPGPPRACLVRKSFAFQGCGKESYELGAGANTGCRS
jgi:hypothetical protein